jgi:hypothetical protein
MRHLYLTLRYAPGLEKHSLGRPRCDWGSSTRRTLRTRVFAHSLRDPAFSWMRSARYMLGLGFATPRHRPGVTDLLPSSVFQ